jgi:hypothetical protein
MAQADDRARSLSAEGPVCAHPCRSRCSCCAPNRTFVRDAGLFKILLGLPKPSCAGESRPGLIRLVDIDEAMGESAKCEDERQPNEHQSDYETSIRPGSGLGTFRNTKPARHPCRLLADSIRSKPPGQPARLSGGALADLLSRDHILLISDVPSQTAHAPFTKSARLLTARSVVRNHSLGATGPVGVGHPSAVQRVRTSVQMRGRASILPAIEATELPVQASA